MAERRKRGRLSRSGDFDRVYRDGRSHANRFLVLYAFPRSEPGPDRVRLGISVSRKVGGAVERTAVKRALREAFWALDDALPSAHDFVIVARPDAAGLVEREGTAGVGTALAQLLAESGLKAA
jgi:ribonuclease P protein component